MNMKPELGMVTVLRPFDNFESVYQGASSDIPIAFPGSLDPLAGKDGYSSALLRGQPIPGFSRVMLWVPQVLGDAGETINVITHYRYELKFRLRTPEEYIQSVETGTMRVPSFHLKSLVRGRDSALNFLPGATKIVAFQQSEPGSAPAELNLWPEAMVPFNDPVWTPPLLPDGTEGVWQQSVYPFTGDETIGPTFLPFEFDMEGDELLILCYKTTATAWDFSDSAEDQGFSAVYGTNNGADPPNPNIGILLASGIGAT